MPALPTIFPRLKKYAVPALLTAIIILAAVLRSKNMTIGLSLDETATWQIASQQASAALRHTFYPLTYILSHFTLKLGNSEALLRIPTFIAGLLGVWLMYFLGKTWHSPRAGLVASFLLSLSSIHIYYSNQARFYSFVILATILLLYAIKKILDQPKCPRNWLLYIASLIIGPLSHPFFLPVIWSSVPTAFIVTLWQKGIRAARLHLVLLIVITILGLVPLAAVIIEFHKAHPTIETPPSSTHVQQHFTLKPAEYIQFYRSYLLYQQPQKCVPLFFLMLGGAFFLYKRHRAQSLIIIAVPVLVPLPFFFISVAHNYSLRYFTMQTPIAMLLIAICLVELASLAARKLQSAYSHRVRQQSHSPAPSPILHCIILVAMLTLLTKTYLASYLYDYHYRDYWKEEANLMAPYLTKDDVILYFAPYDPRVGPRNPLPSQDSELGFYLHQVLIPGRRDNYPTKRYYAPDQASVDQILLKNPNSNVWLINRIAPPYLRLSNNQNQIFKLLLVAQTEMLQVAGAPTTNLITQGDIETTDIQSLHTSGSVQLLPRPSAGRKSETCLHLGPAPAIIQFSVHPPVTSATTTILDPGKNYILSCDLKYEQVPGNPTTTGSVAIALTGTLPNGHNFTQPIKNFYWWSDWHFQDFPIRQQDYPQAFAATSLQIQISYTGNSGEMWIDNIQFEVGEHPTPYVNGIRLPHDQALQALQQESHTQ